MLFIYFISRLVAAYNNAGNVYTKCIMTYITTMIIKLKTGAPAVPAALGLEEVALLPLPLSAPPRSVGFRTGMGRVGKSDTVPVPAHTVPVTGRVRYWRVTGAVLYETRGTCCTRGCVPIRPPCNLTKATRVSIDTRCALREVLGWWMGGGVVWWKGTHRL